MTVPLRKVIGALAEDLVKRIDDARPIGGARHDNYVVLVAKDEAAEVLEAALDEIAEDPDGGD